GTARSGGRSSAWWLSGPRSGAVAVVMVFDPLGIWVVRRVELVGCERAGLCPRGRGDTSESCLGTVTRRGIEHEVGGDGRHVFEFVGCSWCSASCQRVRWVQPCAAAVAAEPGVGASWVSSPGT